MVPVVMCVGAEPVGRGLGVTGGGGGEAISGGGCLPGGGLNFSGRRVPIVMVVTGTGTKRQGGDEARDQDCAQGSPLFGQVFRPPSKTYLISR
jgi:hypothetical protein